MNDEKYTFIEDCREKKSTGRSYYNRVTHGGRVRLPSDNLTQKELREMSGECKSYRLNDPMKWAEFKDMPDDLKIAYIQAIRERYRVSDTKIFEEMLGISQSYGKHEIVRLGIGLGRGTRRSSPDLEGWNKWLHGETQEKEAEPAVEPEAQEAVPDEIVKVIDTEEVAAKVSAAFTKASESMKKFSEALHNGCDKMEEAISAEKKMETIVPESGNMLFHGNAQNVLESIGMILKDANVSLSVSWNVVDVNG